MSIFSKIFSSFHGQAATPDSRTVFSPSLRRPASASSSSDAGRFFPKSPTPREIAGRIGISLRDAFAYASGGYKVVSGRDQLNRSYVAAECGDEYKQLTITDRNRIIAFARKLVRNSDQMESMLHQFEVQVVGPVGGKAVFDLGSSSLDDPNEARLTSAFASWAKHCEFFEDLNLNEFLKLVLRTQIIGGDLVVVFDDDLVSDSGQLIAFEPDCIGNIPDADFKRLFPGYTQHQGIIKDPNSKTVGAIVSWSQRGQSTYALTTKDENGATRMAAWPLIKASDSSWDDSLFMLHRNIWRFNQQRGSSGLWAALATLCDLTDLQSYEIQSAKKNAQTIGQLLNEEGEDKKNAIDPNYNPDVTAPVSGAASPASLDNSDGQIASDQNQPTDDEVDIDFEVLNAAGCIYQAMPKNVRMELFDTKHPNANMPQFINWLQRTAAYTLGLASFHATGKADSSYSAAMAEIMLSQKSFDDAWHKLEASLLDWIMRRWHAWAKRHGLFPLADSALPEDWMRTCVTWERPRQKALNPVDEQRAWSEGLRNGSVCDIDIHGANWKKSLRARKRLKEAYAAAGLRYFPETDNNGMNTENQEPKNKETSKDEDL